KPYDPKTTEARIYKLWEDSGYFNPDNLPERHTEPYTIIMPPPNANGSLHAGHAVFVTIEDLLARYNRMRGYKTLWLPGADHAGFETQTVYEKKLEREGRSRFGMDPDALRKEIMDFTLASKSFMEGQLRQLGASCDWSREKFTLDPDIVAVVYETFKKLHDDGLAYRGERSVNWCTKHQTSLSELETLTEERADPLYYMKYGPFILATVRPETKFGDTAVAVNPNDERYKEWIGKEIEFDGLIGKVRLKVIADDYVDPAFGTGVVKITPAHDPNDFEVAKRHDLRVVEVIDQYGKLTEKCGKYAGLKVEEARKRVAEDLASAGLLDHVDESYRHAVKKCYKCERVLEPRILPQWFVKMKPLAAPVIESIERGEVVFYPDHYKKIMLHWLSNIEDWNISRQIVWGIPIPAWYKDKEVRVGETSPGEGWKRDSDTFDTWFSSGQWPFATLMTTRRGGADFDKFYPTQVMETAGEIIFFWVARMLMLGLYRTGKLPFATVYLHGIITAKDGKKMSKSRGNVISPLDLSEKYGTDALRMGLIIGNTPGTSSALYEEKIRAYKLFANKLWNVSRFILAEEGDLEAPLTQDDMALWGEFSAMAKEVTENIDEYRFYMAGEKLYHYVWHRLADEILEESKAFLKGSDLSAKSSRANLLLRMLTESVKLLHPFMPFITEEIWSAIPQRNKGLLMVEPWPTHS
ncbi:valine--tRNA ligase, partial [Candidatus Parcubacteria bacterium]|nr:valine--tRNA ligase [Candidatus Parcubacteria bacterium]